MSTYTRIGGGLNSNQSNPDKRASRRAETRDSLQRKLKLLSVTACAVAGLMSKSAIAASGSWTGATDANWADNNWSASPVPGSADTAIFNNTGGSYHTIDLGAGVTVGNILFDSANAAAYTIGNYSAGTQTLSLNASGGITMNSTVANNELFNAGIVLGTDANAASYSITNNSLTFASNFTGGPTGGTAGTETLTVGGAGSTTISGSLINGGAAQTLALTKNGTGTLTFNGTVNATNGLNSNGAYGTVTVNSGTLGLDFSNFTGVGADLLNQYTNPLTMAGGTLKITGNATYASSQSFVQHGIVSNPGLNTFTLLQNGSGPIPTLNLGTFTQNIGSQAVFNGPAYYNGISTSGVTTPTANVAATGTITTTTAGTNTNLLTPSTRVAVATVGLYNWASVSTTAGTNTIYSGDQVSGFYTQLASGATVPNANANYDLLGNAVIASSNPAYVSTLRFNVPGAYTATTGTSGLFVLEGILVTPNVGANNTTFANGGQWCAGAATNNDSIDVYQNNTAGELLFNVPIYYYSKSSYQTNYVQGGPGTVALTGQGTLGSYYGSAYLNGGDTIVNNDNQLGRAAGGTTLYLNGGTVVASANTTLDNSGANQRPVSLLGNGGGLAAFAGTTLTVDGQIGSAAGAGTLVIGIPASSANGNVAGLVPGTGAGTANLANYATGTVALTYANNAASNFQYSPTLITGGATLQINSQYDLGGSNAGSLTFNNGTLQYSSTLATGTAGTATDISAQPVILSGNATIDTNGHSITYANSIGGGGAGLLTVISTATGGSLTLAGANTYTGGTNITSGTLNVTNTTGSATGTGLVTINGGTLSGSGIIGGTVNLSSGAIAPGAAGTKLTAGGLIYNGGTLAFNLSGGTGIGTQTASSILVTNAVFNATPTLAISSVASAGKIVSGETFTLFTSTNAITGSSYLSSIPSLGTFGRITLAASQSGNSIIATATGSAATLTWAGGVSGLTTGTAPQGDGSTWNNTQTTGASNWNNGGKYDYFYDNDNVTFNDTANASNHVVNLTTVNSPGSLTINTASTYTFNGSGGIAGTSFLNLSGGTLNLNTVNTYTGGTNISAGTTLAAGAVGALPSTGTVTVAGTLNLGGFNQSIGTLSGGAGTTGVITNGGSAPAILSTVVTGTTTYGGLIKDNVGTVSLSDSGTGSLTLTGANTYSGGTTLAGGTLLINNGSAAVSGASAIGTGPLTISGGTIDTSTAGLVLGTNNPVTISGSFGFGGTNNMNLGSGAVSLANSSTITLGGTGKTLTLGGVATNTTASAVTTTVNLSATGSGNTLALGGLALSSGGTAVNDVFSGSANINILGPVTDGSASGSGLTYSGTGTMTLSGSNTYTGPTTITGGASLTATQGTLVIPAGASLTTSSSLTVGPGAVLSIAGGTVTLPSVAGNPYSLFQAGGNGTNIYISSGSLTYGNNAGADPNTALIGKFTQTGGTVVTAESNIAPGVGNGSQLYIGGGTYTSNPGLYASFTVGTRGEGTVLVDGTGALTVNGDANPGAGDNLQLIVGLQYSGSNNTKHHWFIQQGGSVTTNGLVLGAMAASAVTGSTGLYYLNGGTLTTSTLNLGTEGLGRTTGTLYFGGGTFNSGTSFSTDPNITTVINSGGATINTSGGSLTWTGALQAGVTGTVNGFTGLVGGSGYFPAPTVTISPSNTVGGATASADAVINAQGQVIDIVIVNPGSGYTTPPTFSITAAAGGTGSGASATGVAPLTAPGGLTKIGSNMLTLSSSGDTYAGPTNVSGGVLVVQSGSLPTGNSVSVALGAALVDAQNSVLGSAGSLNINGSAIIQNNPSLQTITKEVAGGYNGGAWNGSSSSSGIPITSSAAASDPTHLHALGVILNDSTGGTGGGSQIYSSFGGYTSLNDSDVLIKYTYYGDALLTGSVTSADYTQIDNGYLSQTSATPLTGWFNGDFNYDGVINGSDYTLIDNAFNTQGAQISAEIATPTDLTAGGSVGTSVPEPATLGLLGIGAAGLLGRRRRR